MTITTDSVAASTEELKEDYDLKKQIKTNASHNISSSLSSKTSKFPKSTFFIVGQEFCERFCFFGMRTILPLYFTAWLGFSEDHSTMLIHTFNSSAYLFTLVGGIIADSYWGKFWTILVLSLVYCLGSIVMATAAIPSISGIPAKPYGAFVGLFLLALGTGGIKPCVSSFGGDQFPADAKPEQRDFFFTLFYFAINAGSVISMFMTPLLRSDVHCFGQNSCYSLAFGLPAILMICATIIFISGYALYKHAPMEENLLVKVAKLVGTSLKCKLLRPKQHKGVKFLDCSMPAYSAQFIRDVRRLFRVLKLFIPISFFWALYDQQGSRWTFQAMMMNKDLHMFGRTVSIKPEQMGIINAVLILVLIPFYDFVVYPLLRWMGFRMRPLSRMAWGMILAMLSFVVAAVIQFYMTAKGTFVTNPLDPQSQMCIHGCVHILWQFPQYFLLTCGEIMLSLTGLTFSYSQAPSCMKSVCSAAWLLTVCLGNFIVIIVTETEPVRWFTHKNVAAWNFVLWTLVLAIGLIWYLIYAYKYVYLEDEPEELVDVQIGNGDNNNEEKKI